MLLLSCCLSASNPCLSTGLYDAEADIQLTTLFPGPADFLFGSVHRGALEEDLNTGGEGLLLACFLLIRINAAFQKQLVPAPNVFFL